MAPPSVGGLAGVIKTMRAQPGTVQEAALQPSTGVASAEEQPPVETQIPQGSCATKRTNRRRQKQRERRKIKGGEGSEPDQTEGVNVDGELTQLPPAGEHRQDGGYYGAPWHQFQNQFEFGVAPSAPAAMPGMACAASAAWNFADQQPFLPTSWAPTASSASSQVQQGASNFSHSGIAQHRSDMEPAKKLENTQPWPSDTAMAVRQKVRDSHVGHGRQMLHADTEQPESEVLEGQKAKRALQAVKAAAGVHSSIMKTQLRVWQSFRQEFEVQKLVWDSVPIQDSFGNLRAASEFSERPDDALRHNITHILKDAMIDPAGSSQRLTQEVRKDAECGCRLNNAMCRVADNVAKAELAAVARLRLAGILHNSGRRHAPAQEPHQSEADLESLVKSCDFDTDDVEPCVRKALGLPVIEPPVVVEAPAPAPKENSRLSKASANHIPIIRSGRSSSADSCAPRRKRHGSQRRVRSWSSSRSKSSKTNHSESSSSNYSLISITEGKVMRL